MTGGYIIAGLVVLGVLGTVYVLWHARTKLKLTKEAIRDTDLTGSGSGGP